MAKVIRKLRRLRRQRYEALQLAQTLAYYQLLTRE